jgi:NhaP-type Na+/H+ or K+/H+ antiporter
MNTDRRILLQAVKLAFGFVLISAALPVPAYAYVDPISGSIILQVIAAGALAAAYTFKRFTHSIRETARGIWARVRKV